MKLREFVSVALVDVMTLSLAAYGGPRTVETTAVPDTTTTVESSMATGRTETEATEPASTGGVAKEDLKVGFIYVGDENEGYTTAHYAGATEMKEVLDLFGDQIIAKWNIPESETVKDAAMNLADQGCQIVSVDSLGHESYVIKAAKEYPEVQSYYATGLQVVSSGLDNMHNYSMSTYKARYVSGMVTGPKLNQMIGDGIVVKDACKIGYVGAYPYIKVISGYTSFFLGVRSVCSDAVMEVKCTNSRVSFGLEEEAAGALISDGCVLISRHADIIDASTACETASAPCVGYNTSMIATAPEQALTSASNSWDAYVTKAVKHVLDGTGIPVDRCKGPSNGVILITELNEAVVAPRTKEEVEEVELKLASDEPHVLDTSAWIQDGKTLDTYKEDDSDIEYISDGYFHESEFTPAPALDILTDRTKTIDN